MPLDFRTAVRGHAPLILVLLLLGCGAPRSDGQDAELRVSSLGASATREQILRTIAADPSFGFERGSRDAPITVIEFSDFGCGFCGRFALDVFPTIDAEYITAGKVRWKYVSIAFFQGSAEAAVAASCAAEAKPELFWTIRRRLHESRSRWQLTNSWPTFQALAAELAVDAEDFRDCFGNGTPMQEIMLGNDVAALLQVNSTPTFLINGRTVEGMRNIDDFRRLIAEAGG